MVSVIIPTYNRAKYIDRAIKSVLSQTYEDFEIIVVDDNDQDSDARKEMEDIMSKYNDNIKVKYIKHLKNQNGAAARNTGIKESKGDFITFLDDDDFFFNTRLEKLVSDLEKNKEYDAVYSSCAFFENGKIKKINYAKKSGNLQLDMLRQIPFFSTGSNMFFRRNALIELNGFDVSFFRHQDLEIMVRFFNKNSILADNEVLVAKCEEDKANFPNIDKAIIYKEHFLNTFIKEIYESGKKSLILHDNYFNLLKNSIRAKKYKSYKRLKNKIKNNSYITLNDKITLTIEFIDSYIPILNIYRNLRKRNYAKTDIDKSISQYEFINR